MMVLSWHVDRMPLMYWQDGQVEEEVISFCLGTSHSDVVMESGRIVEIDCGWMFSRWSIIYISL
jgi:hypothetical protein